MIDEAGQLSLADCARGGHVGAQPDPARRSAAARARLAGRPPGGHEPERPRAPARRARDGSGRPRPLPRGDPAHAPGSLRLHLRRGLREPPPLASRLRRQSVGGAAGIRHLSVAAPRQLLGLARRRHRRSAPRSRSCSTQPYRDVGRPRAPAHAARLHGRHALQRAGARALRMRCRRACGSARSTASRARRRRSSSTPWRPRAVRTRRATSRFLFSRNRLNVAVSRARCLAYLVCAPALLETRAKTLEQMRLISTLCSLCRRRGRRSRRRGGLKTAPQNP